MQEYHGVFKSAKGHAHRGADESLGGGAGMKVLSTEQVMKGQFAGAGIKTKKQELSGEQMMKLQEIETQKKEQDTLLDAISTGLDDLKDLAEKMQDVSLF